MGQPLFNNYTLFRALSKPIRIEGHPVNHDLGQLDWERNYLLDILREFNLFAFILHDPESHPEFDAYINSAFDRLDRSTGEKFLFFTLVNPGINWIRRRQHHRFYSEIRNFENRAIRLNIKPLFTSDPSTTAYALACALGIPADELPVILITEDLESRRYICAGTSVHKVSDQLNQLGKLARFSHRGFRNLTESVSNSPGFVDVRDYHQTLDIPYLDSSLADTLSNVLSFVSYSADTNERDRTATGLQVSNVLNRLQEMMNARRMEIEDTESEISKVESIGIHMGNLMSLLSDENYQGDRTILEIEKRYLEHDSLKMLITALKVRDFLSDNNVRLNDLRLTHIDFSPAAICFAKFFEREVNLSFVHWIRKYLGVHLPRYFDRYEPNLNATYLPDNMGYQDPNPVNFNHGNYNNWRPPSLGQSRICVDSISRKEVFETNFHYARMSVVKEFVRQWRELKDIRNSAAHPRILSQADLERMVSILSEMNHSQVFKSMYEMKSKFRN